MGGFFRREGWVEAGEAQEEEGGLAGRVSGAALELAGLDAGGVEGVLSCILGAA